MPSISDFMAHFGLKDLLLTLLVLACVIIGREERRIFRRKKR